MSCHNGSKLLVTHTSYLLNLYKLNHQMTGNVEVIYYFSGNAFPQN